MIGMILGIGTAISYLSLAWKGSDQNQIFSSGLGQIFGAFAICLFAGILIFPRTVGFALTPASLLTPIAFIIACIRGGLTFGFVILALGLGMWLVTFIIGQIRKDAV